MPDAVPHRYHRSAEFCFAGGLCDWWPLLAEPTLSVDVRKPCRSTFRKAVTPTSSPFPGSWAVDPAGLSEVEVGQSTGQASRTLVGRVASEYRRMNVIDSERLLSPHAGMCATATPTGSNGRSRSGSSRKLPGRSRLTSIGAIGSTRPWVGSRLDKGGTVAGHHLSAQAEDHR